MSTERSNPRPAWTGRPRPAVSALKAAAVVVILALIAVPFWLVLATSLSSDARAAPMPFTNPVPQISRRTVLRTTGAAAVAAPAAPALAACGGSKTSSGGAQSNVGKQLMAWPTYTPAAGLHPDMPGTAAGVQDTFLRYPSTLIQSVPAKPGDGSKVRALIVT